MLRQMAWRLGHCEHHQSRALGSGPKSLVVASKPKTSTPRSLPAYLVDAVERALMDSARSREQAAEWLLGREYVCASVLEEVSTLPDVYAEVSTDIDAHDSRG